MGPSHGLDKRQSHNPVKVLDSAFLFFRPGWDSVRETRGTEAADAHFSPQIRHNSSEKRCHLGVILHGHGHTSCTKRGSAWLIRSLAAMSTCLPLRMNEAEFICDMIAPRGDQENLKERGLFAHSSAGRPPQ